MNIKHSISEQMLKKIFPLDVIVELANELVKEKNLDVTAYSAKNGKLVKSKAATLVSENWDYEFAKNFARRILSEVLPDGSYRFDKYDCYVSAKKNYLLELDRIYKGVADFNWSTSQGNFDQFVQTINRNFRLSQQQKEKLIREGAENHRAISRFNTIRNDFVEFLLFESHEDIFPTIKHSKGIDFFIEGIPFDQKVSRSLGSAFIKKFENKDEALKEAHANPLSVAKSLFENQDPGRFSASDVNRVFVVFTEDVLTPLALEAKLKTLELKDVQDVSATIGGKTYTFQTIITLI